MYHTLSDKRGSANILWIGVISVSIMVFMLVFTFSTATSEISHVKNYIQNAIDIYTINTGKEIMQSIKSGHDYTPSINSNTVKKSIGKELNLSNTLKAYNADGTFLYEIRDVKVEYIIDNTLKIKVSYTLVYQYYFNARPYRQSEIPMEQESLYNLKY